MRNALARGTRITESVSGGCLCRLGLTVVGAIAEMILLVSMGAVRFQNNRDQWQHVSIRRKGDIAIIMTRKRSVRQSALTCKDLQ